VVLTDMPDHVVWVPTNSAGELTTLGVTAGAVVRVAKEVSA
jgi:NADH-quinone oxidoreductase subunit G